MANLTWFLAAHFDPAPEINLSRSFHFSRPDPLSANGARDIDIAAEAVVLLFGPSPHVLCR